MNSAIRWNLLHFQAEVCSRAAWPSIVPRPGGAAGARSSLAKSLPDKAQFDLPGQPLRKHCVGMETCGKHF
jgi:hypothetical protein